ncbi:MAG: hypothetical protein ACQEXX_01255 [Bacillota bacterium]
MFYAILTNDKGTKMVKGELPADRLGAANVAAEYAKLNKLTVQGIYPALNHRKQGQVLTKNSKHRRATLGHR